MRCKSDSDALAVGKLPKDLPHCDANFAPSYCRGFGECVEEDSLWE